jgi:hypothetical protein
MLTRKENPNSTLSWEERKVKLKRTFPKLTGADLNYTEVTKFEMFNRLEFKLAMTTEEINEIMDTQ